MEERVLLEPDIDEGGFEAVFEVADFAFEDAADEALLGRAFDGEFLELAVFEHGDAGFERLGIDDDFLVDLLDRLDEALDFLDQRRCRRAEGFHDSPGLFFDGDWLKVLVFLHFGGSVQSWVRGNRLSWPGLPAFPRAVLLAAGPRRCSRPARFRSYDGGHTLSPQPAGRRRLLRGLGWLPGRVVVAGHVPARGSGENACRGAGGRSFCHSYSNSPFDRCARFAACLWRLTSPALMTRRSLTAAVGCPSQAQCECSCRY